MRCDGIVGDTDSHPNGALLGFVSVRAATHHLEHPGLVGIGHREGLALGIIAVLLDELGHDLQGLTGSLGTLEGDVDQRTIVDNARRVNHFLTASEGGLTDGDLPLVRVSDHIPRLSCLGNLTQILVGVPLVHLPHIAQLMLGSGIMIEGHEGAERVCVVGDEDRTIGAGFLTYNEIGTCHRITSYDEHDGENQMSFHTLIYYISFKCLLIVAMIGGGEQKLMRTARLSDG